MAIGLIVGFLAVVTFELEPAAPETQLPGQYRLAALIQRQQKNNERERSEVYALRNRVDAERTRILTDEKGVQSQQGGFAAASLQAGTVPMRGTGFTVTLDDSSLSSSPTGNVNDIVIHSHDVQAVVNGMWRAGAEAIAINGQRVVSTTAVLCVGNTLLLNGTVHSPPYEISAIDANRTAFDNDPLVRQLHSDADRFSLRFSTSQEKTIEVPAFGGSTVLKYAKTAS